MPDYILCLLSKISGIDESYSGIDIEETEITVKSSDMITTEIACLVHVYLFFIDLIYVTCWILVFIQ